MFSNCGGGEDSWEVPWTARRSNQSILKEINPEYSLEGLMLKLKLQYFLSDVKNWLTGKVPDAGKDWRREEKGTTEDEMVGWHHRLNGYEFEQTPEIVKDREAWCAAVHGGHKEPDNLVTTSHNLVTEQQQQTCHLVCRGDGAFTGICDVLMGWVLFGLNSCVSCVCCHLSAGGSCF